ncbi:MAG: transglycosylase domain-containing protein [Candidatus Manganitrophus sp.]|nr:transglycosylase domain-containing protein [Candidatus Manganitrophus sp.]WDT70262.1 MAG: transglycosylase domain-containing protein [Candidatus Manganitrophus sp.]
MDFPVENDQEGKRPFRWLKWLLLSLLSLVLIAAFSVGGIIWYFSRDLPSLEMLGSYEPSQATRIYSDDNRLVGQFYIEKRVFVPLTRMPKELIQAILAVEDSRFYEHGGFDYIRIIKAFLTNLENMRIRQGASTITQQLTRSLFLTPERTMERKLKEILLARKMEMMLTKDEILEIYLNQIYFGHGAYGVQVAARTYFGKDVGELQLAEVAFLSGLPKAPNDYSPIAIPKRRSSAKGSSCGGWWMKNLLPKSNTEKPTNKIFSFKKWSPTKSWPSISWSISGSTSSPNTAMTPSTRGAQCLHDPQHRHAARRQSGREDRPPGAG